MNHLQKQYERAVVASGLLLATAIANAGPLEDMFDQVDLSGISAKIVSVAGAIIGIALVMKGPSLVKRLIGKI